MFTFVKVCGSIKVYFFQIQSYNKTDTTTSNFSYWWYDFTTSF